MASFPPRVCGPAPGNRGRGAGTLYAVGYNGYSWSSSFTGTGTYRLAFNYGGIYPNSSSNRAYGFQLRCLQE